MNGSEQLKKRLRSVRLSGQLASAMKTVASAKYAKITRLREQFGVYERELNRMLGLCCADFHGENGSLPEGRICYVILGHNRGLCGGYNTELHAYVLSVLQNNPEALIVVCGKSAIACLESKKIPIGYRFLLPDVPEMGDCRPLADRLYTLCAAGEIGSVQILYQRFVNTLTQEPAALQLFPMRKLRPEGDFLMIPDKNSLAEELQRREFDAALYRAVSDAAMGAQAATLMAMRTAFDNANQTAAKLEHEINKIRQSAVTSGVIETSSGALNEGEENDGCGR